MSTPGETLTVRESGRLNALIWALLLLAVDAGAFVAQVAVLRMGWLHTIVIGAMLTTLVYLQRHQILARLAKS